MTADEVIYDQGANTLTASGNVELKEANGNVIRADRYTLTDDFRDGFVQSLSVVARDDSRITAERGERREGNVTEFSNGTFTACKSEGGVPPLWCIGAQKDHPRSGRSDDQLPGRAVRAVRPAGLLHALLPAPRPVGEAQERLPGARTTATRSSSAS